MVKYDRLHGQTCILSNIGAVGGSQAYTAIIDYPIPWGLISTIPASRGILLKQFSSIYIYRGEMVKHKMGISCEKNKSIGEKEKMLNQIPSTATVEHDIIVIYVYIYTRVVLNVFDDLFRGSSSRVFVDVLMALEGKRGIYIETSNGKGKYSPAKS